MSLSTDHSQAVLESEGMGTGSSRADRPTSFRAADFAVPTGAEEEWRFTPMDRVADFVAEVLEARPAPVTGDDTLETVGRDDPRLGRTGAPDDRAGALAWEAFSEAKILTVPAGSDEERVIRVDAPRGMNAAHVVIEVEDHATATVVIEHTGSGELAEGIEVLVGDGAHVTVVSVQEGERTARHFSTQSILVGAGAQVRHILVTLGGDVVRVSTNLAYTGEGGDVQLLGAYITDAGEHHEHRIFVDHNEPNCVSRVTYKGALQGDEAHAVWIGDVLIRPEARGTDSYELNRNLVLTRGAKADSVPNLEIETGEIVGAGHASATGRFDEEQLFYLQARGIPEDIARRLVVRGFFAELVDQIGVESVQHKLMAAIERELDLAGVTGNEADAQ
ncbi:MAG: Fe-S cluster assembly protein SufD [Ancrocorticia sp.]|jgi:Fe-S cluster assembly protein SufD|nr:Fe-S cluster assembly protein SufD [Ancrocorticia sp.]MCI1895664.1 Fe-S cluster assembly protein SufD [Ancrocorticia sp.]MCI1932401.1 Fe-S cluster assembly protein SufD [Ancrocorticia sp.]MCI1962940.1 Fe-S cluster assembly protein SufD [Ancrocorticia sp.]MCI2001308.1 Fe-S cluster assembly protein SufD [Ancrocorticia sp.]